MNILFNKQRTGFTMVANGLLSATNLSLKAKALYAYLLSKPSHWSFSTTRIANEMLEGKDAINNIMNELEEIHLLSRRKIKDKKSGKWTGVAYYLVDINDSDITTEFFNNHREKINTSKPIDERKEEFRLKCLDNYKGILDGPEAKRFYEYWSEQTYGQSKMKFEMMSTFDIKRRMHTWKKNSKKFNNISDIKNT